VLCGNLTCALGKLLDINQLYIREHRAYGLWDIEGLELGGPLHAKKELGLWDIEEGLEIGGSLHAKRN
jgi:hypothetical protein